MREPASELIEQDHPVMHLGGHGRKYLRFVGFVDIHGFRLHT